MSDTPVVDPVNNPPSHPPAEPKPQPAGTRAAKQPAKRAPAKKAPVERLAQVRPVPEERSYADAITKEHRDFLKDEGVDVSGGSFAG